MFKNFICDLCVEVGFFVRLFEALDGGGHALILYHDSRINQHKDWDQPLFVTKCPDLQIESVILYGQCPFYCMSVQKVELTKA